jgi:hypothetical protein
MCAVPRGLRITGSVAAVLAALAPVGLVAVGSHAGARGSSMANDASSGVAMGQATQRRRAFGDFNGDGLADLAVQGPVDRVDEDDSPLRHSAVVILGSRAPANVDLRAAAPPIAVRIRSALNVSMDGAVGDVDGDGFGDVRVSTSSELDEGPEGGTYVVFGGRDLTDIDLDRATPRVLPIPDQVVSSGPVGDLNDDGAEELVFYRTGPESSLAVILGRPDRAPIRPATLRKPGRRGFVIDRGRWSSGANLATAAGDADGDGIDDLALVMETYTYCGEGGSGCGGRAFVVFGRRRPVSLDIRGSLRSRRFELVTRRGGRPAGYYVNAVLGYGDIGTPGDFDGDRRDDLFGVGWEYGQGTVLVYGRRSTRPPRANPPRAPDAARVRPTPDSGVDDDAGPLGDINGDRRGDVLVADGRWISVILGRRARETIDPRRLGRRGWRMRKPRGVELEWSGRIGDMNGDRLADFALSAAPSDDLLDARVRTYVVFGTRTTTPGSLDRLGARGIVIE